MPPTRPVKHKASDLATKRDVVLAVKNLTRELHERVSLLEAVLLHAAEPPYQDVNPSDTEAPV